MKTSVCIPMRANRSTPRFKALQALRHQRRVLHQRDDEATSVDVAAARVLAQTFATRMGLRMSSPSGNQEDPCLHNFPIWPSLDGCGPAPSVNTLAGGDSEMLHA